MCNVKWRHALVLVALLGCLFAAAGQPVAAQTVRKSITALSPSELMSLRRGVAQMQAWDTADRTSPDFRRSWIYWANMHAHFGDDCEGAITGNNMQDVTEWTASNSAETATWCKCEHGSNQFLTWHRMFIYYFEQVLRQAANDSALTLPYWDWATDARLPQALRAQTYVNEDGETMPNPLYVPERRTTLNSGSAALATTTTSTHNAMLKTTYTKFSSALESTPHGSVHCAVTQGGCPHGYMGSVAAAGLDPMFYLHHANIDRLYECWLQVKPSSRLPTGSAILNKRYSFIDGSGSVVQRKVGDMRTTQQLGYSYTSGAGCPAGSGPSAVVASAANAPAAAPSAVADTGSGMDMDMTADVKSAPAAAATPADTELNRGVTDVPIGVTQTVTPGLTGGTITSATVTISGVKVSRVPGALYNVFLANEAGQRVNVGVMSFFGM